MMNQPAINRGWRTRARRLLAAIAMAVLVVIATPAVAQAKTVEVHDVKGLLVEIARSRQEAYTDEIVLKADIDFRKDDPDGTHLEQIVKEHGSLTFGDKDHPFRGTFDGDGHCIIGLNYKRDFWKPAANTGLFSFTEGAYIHDIHFRDCYIGADYRGGVVVGHAERTRIESIRIVNCTISVTPANNAVSLITNAGLMGGMVVGEMVEGSRLYDCTVQGGRVVNNSVIGVSGLGGECLYLGALAGSAEDSEIEYCRVLPNERYYEDRAKNPNLSVYERDADGNYLYQTEVYNRYEVAVGAVAGQGIYAGGIVGYTDNVDVVDCFSTAWVHTWVANYVGVGSGNIGYVGGIIAYANSSTAKTDASRVIRCHYAGNMESFQWNSIAVIPIIQSNVYLSGLVERDWEEDTQLVSSYFKRNDVKGRESAIKPHPKGYVRAWGDWLGLDNDNGVSPEGFGYGPIVDDAKYADRLFWEGEDYDFEGDEVRYSSLDADKARPHVNKWIMDEYLGIPVHGASVKTTLDFPGAGSVTVEPTQMGKQQVTSDPYNFAVQPVSVNEKTFTVEATTIKAGQQGEDGAPLTPEVSDTANNGAYRFMGWYRQQGVTVNHVKAGDHAYFDPIVAPDPAAKLVSEEPSYTAKNSGTGGATAGEFVDNDLFVAHHQAQVLFHDVNGKVIDKKTSMPEDTPAVDDDWYNHQDALPAPAEPTKDRAAAGGPVNDGARFLGWTTMRNDKGDTAGWPDVATSDLNRMKREGEFYEGGEPIERPMDLYPVYASVASNITVVMEGNELDDVPDSENLREGVAEAELVADKGTYTLTIKGAGENGALPDGYRFMGWYELDLDEAGKPQYTEVEGVHTDATANAKTARKYQCGRKVSADPTWTIPGDVDLTQPHAYYARFEYRVDYYAKAIKGGNKEWENYRLYTVRWKTYLSNFERLKGPQFDAEVIEHWSLSDGGCVVDDEATTYLENGIVSPHVVYSHNKSKGAGEFYDIVATFDFPNSAKIEMSGNAGGLIDPFTLTAKMTSDGFEFIGWSWEKKSEAGIDRRNPWKTGAHVTQTNYVYEAHTVAKVTFVGGADGDGDLVVKRAYSDCAQDTEFANGFLPVFVDEDWTYQFRYQHYTNDTGVGQYSEVHNGLTVDIGKSPSDAAMQAKRPNSLFVGWIDQSAIAAGEMTQEEYNAVYNQDTQTSRVSLAAIAPYLVGEKALCERPMTLYPVYVDYRYETTTNITRGTALTDPADPTVEPAGRIESGDDQGLMALTVSADVDDQTAAAYELVSWTIERPEGTVIDTITATGADGHPVADGQDGTPVSNANAKLSYNIIAGTKHVIVANYHAKADAKLNVTYHVRPAGDAAPTITVEKKVGDLLGHAPAPEFEVQGAVLVGWSEQQPANGGDYLMFDKDNPVTLVDELTVVERSMELWPVYRVVTTGGEGDTGVDVCVNSNIDKEIHGTDHRAAVVKTAETPQGTQSYVSLEAKPVDGYKFLGWYKDYKSVDADGEVVGTPVAGNRVTGDEVFAGNLYTAVYQKVQVYTVVYHFPDGHESTVEIDEGDDTKFIETVKVQKPVLDESGNPTFDKDGNPVVDVVEEQAVVVGGEQTAAIEGALDKANAQGDYRELFYEWEWRKDSGTTVAWEEFCGLDHGGQPGKGIVAHLKAENSTAMHLYPVTHRFNALDADRKAYPAKNLVWQIDPARLAATGPDAADKPAVKIAFAPNTLYVGDELTIHMDQVHYARGAATGAAARTPVNDKTVALYDTFDFANAMPLDSKVTGADNQGEGNAVFTFKTTGSLVIDKTAPTSAAGSTFTFLVTECNADGTDKQDAKSTTVTLTAQAAPGDSTATARGTLSLPWGYYKVVETTWGWRYAPTYRFLENGLTVEGRPENVVLVRGGSTARVTNALQKDKYLDGEDRAKNVFGEGRVDAKGGER